MPWLTDKPPNRGPPVFSGCCLDDVESAIDVPVILDLHRYQLLVCSSVGSITRPTLDEDEESDATHTRGRHWAAFRYDPKRTYVDGHTK